MSDTPTKKTLDQITQDVLNSQFGISDADLSLLFEDQSTDKTPVPTTTVTTPSNATVTEPAPEEPVVAPVVTPAPVEPAPVVPSVTPPEPNRQVETVPDKFESSLNAQKEQIAQMQLLLQELVKRSQVTEPAAPKPVVTPNNPLDEVDDQAIIEKPKENIVKLVQGILKVVLPAAFSEYDVQVTKRQAMDQFRKDHADFDELRPIMRQIVLENPPVNDDVAALPRVYQEAKNRKAAMLEAMRKDLNIQPPAPPAPPTPPAIPEEEMLAKLEQRIVEKIRKRRAALVATSPTTEPVQPVTRQTPTPVEVPKTEADIMFEAMLNAGVPSSGFLKDVETVKK
jgi:hypothetical protein